MVRSLMKSKTYRKGLNSVDFLNGFLNEKILSQCSIKMTERKRGQKVDGKHIMRKGSKMKAIWFNGVIHCGKLSHQAQCPMLEQSDPKPSPEQIKITNSERS